MSSGEQQNLITGHGQRPVTLIMITFTLYRKEKKE